MDAAQLRAAYRSAMREAVRETVRLRRYLPDEEGEFSPITSSPLAAALVSYQADAVAGLIQQGGSVVILLAEDVEQAMKEVPPGSEAAPWFTTPPILRADKIVLASGAELAIEAIDSRTRRIGGVLLAYEIAVKG